MADKNYTELNIVFPIGIYKKQEGNFIYEKQKGGIFIAYPKLDFENIIAGTIQEAENQVYDKIEKRISAWRKEILKYKEACNTI